MRKKPGYILKTEIPDVSIRYRWNSWGSWDMFGFVTDKEVERLNGLSLRAVYALLIGVSEWLVYRFEKLFDNPEPFYKIEAAWAQVIDARYGVFEYFDPEEWNGPVKDPINWAMILVQDYAGYLQQKCEITSGTTRAIRLVQHVLPDDELFLAWLEQVMARLERLYPYTDNDPLGDPVPNEALDPNFEFDVADTEELLNTYLDKLDYDENFYLNDPDLMIEEGYEGVPYKFNLREDREKREVK